MRSISYSLKKDITIGIMTADGHDTGTRAFLHSTTLSAPGTKTHNV